MTLLQLAGLGLAVGVAYCLYLLLTEDEGKHL